MGGHSLNFLLFGSCLLHIGNYDSCVAFYKSDVKISCFVSMECQCSINFQRLMFDVCVMVSTTVYCQVFLKVLIFFRQILNMSLVHIAPNEKTDFM